VEAALVHTETIESVPVAACYHYRGNRYGGFGNHPYEDYMRGLARGEDVMQLRGRFAEIVLSNRPRSMSEALDVDVGDWPIWQFPWIAAPRQCARPITDPNDNPDVMCHWCEAGVLVSHVNREFGWLDGAFASMSSVGYRPEDHSYVRCLELRSDTRSSYLVLDGNHRVGALCAIGHADLPVRLARRPKVRRDEVRRWPRVRNGELDESRALRIFDRYFRTDNPPLRTLNPGDAIPDTAALWATTL
jgi:hypothetical protein